MRLLLILCNKHSCYVTLLKYSYNCLSFDWFLPGGLVHAGILDTVRATVRRTRSGRSGTGCGSPRRGTGTSSTC